MAFLMPFTDAAGVTHAETYWRPAQVNIGVLDKVIYVVFYGFKDSAALAAGKQPLPGAQKAYTISGEDFVEIYTAHLSPGGPNVSQMVYQHAVDTKDVIIDGLQVSFFEEAQQV